MALAPAFLPPGDWRLDLALTCGEAVGTALPFAVLARTLGPDRFAAAGRRYDRAFGRR